MQLKIQRSQRQSGVVSKAVMFCVDARVFLAAEEQANVQKYKLGSQVIYSSQAAKRHVEDAERRLRKADVDHEVAREFSSGHALARGMGHMAVGVLHGLAARLALNITINSIQNGQHIECKDRDEVMEAEGALYDACKNLRAYLLTAATFDGREVVIDFTNEEPEVVSKPLAIAAPVAPAPIVQPMPTEFVAPPQSAASAPTSAENTSQYTASPQSNPFQPALNWWNGLTYEQRKWLMIIGGVAVLFILYKTL